MKRKSEDFKTKLIRAIDSKPNPYHPLVWFSGGKPKIGKNVYIGGFTEIYAKGAKVTIGDNCDIASFVVINCADSHKKTVEVSKTVERRDIEIGKNVFIGTFSAILGGCHIGHHTTIGAGCILKNMVIPPYSLVFKDNEGKQVIRRDYFSTVFHDC